MHVLRVYTVLIKQGKPTKAHGNYLQKNTLQNWKLKFLLKHKNLFRPLNKKYGTMNEVQNKSNLNEVQNKSK